MSYSFAQTFYIDPDLFNGASFISLTSVNLYVWGPPDFIESMQQLNVNYAPGISISISETSGGVPDVTNVLADSNIRVPFSSIPFNGNGGQITPSPISFVFSSPLQLQTGQTYAILVSPEDPLMDFWVSINGNYIRSPDGNETGTVYTFGSQNNCGQNYFTYSTNGTWYPLAGYMLTFNLNVAQYTTLNNNNNINVVLCNKNYEFFNVNNMINQFMGGENVFLSLVNSSNGTVSITQGNNIVTGSGTYFLHDLTANGYLILVSGSNKRVYQINNISSNTNLTLTANVAFTNSAANYYTSPVGTILVCDQLANLVILDNSSANSTLYFGSGNTILGEFSLANAVISNVFNYYVASVDPELFISSTANTTVNLQLTIANSSYDVSNSNLINLVNGVNTAISTYNAYIASRSNEVLNSAGLVDGKSAIIYANVNVTVSNNLTSFYEGPFLTSQILNVYFGQYFINNTNANENTNQGDADARYISEILTLPSGSFAEDLLVNIQAYKPAPTGIYVYAKIYNSSDPESFNNKQWTLLNYTNNTDLQVSSLTNNTDIYEYSFGFPVYPPSNTTPGTAQTTSNSTTIIGSNTTFSSSFAANDIIKIYQSLFPNNYMISVINSIANNTSMTITNPVTNNDIIGSGLSIDLISLPETAFLYEMNSNVVQYYNSSQMLFTTYNSYQLKIVMTSSENNIVPIIYNLRSVCVSA